MQNHVIGVDVSDGKTRKKTFKNTDSSFEKLVIWTKELQLVDPHFCMEATGCYSEGIAEFLYNSGFRISVVNPLQIKSFRMSKMIRQKTDSSDAEVIAHFCLQNDPD
ncbi:MAG: transposase [Holosporaceae bacterium]|jgi:transposase|nr:transposase [Holosporaceae bacterium]